MALFVEWFWVRKFLFLSESADIIRQWGAGYDAPGCVWGIPRFIDIPLGFTKVPCDGPKLEGPLIHYQPMEISMDVA